MTAEGITGADATPDLAWTTIDTPIGPLLLVATDVGLVRVAFAVEGFDAVLADLSALLRLRAVHSPVRLADAAREVEEYFAGTRRAFGLPLDRRLSRGFRRTVHEHLSRIPYGSTASYAEVAAAVGHPRAARAVGSACAANPLPVVVPCHRVVRSDGTVGRYGGGADVKAALLGLESEPPTLALSVGEC